MPPVGEGESQLLGPGVSRRSDRRTEAVDPRPLPLEVTFDRVLDARRVKHPVERSIHRLDLSLQTTTVAIELDLTVANQDHRHVFAVTVREAVAAATRTQRAEAIMSGSSLGLRERVGMERRG